MMHTWESVQKLITEWENPEIKNPWVYEDFKYKAEEFDNVPAVVPRFQFYIQATIRPLVEYLKELKESMTVYELQEETQKCFKQRDESANLME